MAAVTICSDFGAQNIKSVTVSIVSPSTCNEVMGLGVMIFVFWMLSFKPTFSLYSFTFIKKFFSSFSFSAIRVVSSAYLRLLIFLLAILNSVCASWSLAFHIMYSAYKLNKQGDNIQPWHSPFPIWSQSVVPCPVFFFLKLYIIVLVLPNIKMNLASWPAYRFHKRQVRWPCIPITLRVFHSLLWSTQSKALT